MSVLCFMFVFLNKRLDGGAVGVVLIQFNKRFRPVAENVNKQRHLSLGPLWKLHHSFKKMLSL
jgi:hypothetical protein